MRAQMCVFEEFSPRSHGDTEKKYIQSLAAGVSPARSSQESGSQDSGLKTHPS